MLDLLAYAILSAAALGGYLMLVYVLHSIRPDPTTFLRTLTSFTLLMLGIATAFAIGGWAATRVA